jgi:hypothetical protein
LFLFISHVSCGIPFDGKEIQFTYQQTKMAKNLGELPNDGKEIQRFPCANESWTTNQVDQGGKTSERVNA